MEELIVEITKELALVSVAIWILVAALYKLPIPEAKFPKQLMAIVIGIITAIIGYFTKLYTGNPLVIIATAIVGVFLAQLVYDKVKAVVTTIQRRGP